jgi:hypothetical protein
MSHSGDSTRDRIINSLANVIRFRFDHEKVTKSAKKNGLTITHPRTSQTLGDAVLRVLDAIILKMINLVRITKCKTVDINTFLAAAKLIPSAASPHTAQQYWSDEIDAIGKIATELTKKWNGLPAKEKTTLNAMLRLESYFVSGTSIVRYLRSRIPLDWRIGSDRQLKIAVSVFCSRLAEAILDKAGEELDLRLHPGNLAPSHIAKGIHKLGTLDHILGDSVIIGTPLSSIPDLAARTIHHKKRKRPDTSKSESETDTSSGNGESENSGGESNSEEEEKQVKKPASKKSKK